jgi:hypothetical protein
MEDHMNSQFLRRVLLADGAVSGAAGVVMIVGGGFLAPITNLPQPLLTYAGVLLLPWMIALIALARMANVPRAGVQAVIAVNALWVLGSIAVLFLNAPTLFGYAFVIAQAVAVGLFAELQMMALKREQKSA